MAALKNARHEAVLQAYLADVERVGWRAYVAVFPDSSQHAAETAWSRLLKRAEFKARRDELLGAIAAGTVDAAVMDLNEVLAELSKLGRANMRNYIALLTAENLRAEVEALAPEQTAAIQELTVESYAEGGDEGREVKRVKLRLHGKRDALSELRRHHEPDKHEHTGKDGKPIKVEGEPLTDLEFARRVAFILEKGARANAGKGAVARGDNQA